MRSGRRRETPAMGVVVAVPDRRQLDLPPRSLVPWVRSLSQEWALCRGEPHMIKLRKEHPEETAGPNAVAEGAQGPPLVQVLAI